MGKNKQHNHKKIFTSNRRASHDYFIEETLECGISLTGSEVKSIRSYYCFINEAWCSVENGQLILKAATMTGYRSLTGFDEKADPTRDRVLLAHKEEIKKLEKATSIKGYTLIPLKIYESRGKIKVLVGVCRGKHNYDKREALKEKETKRSIDRHLKSISK